MTLPHRHLTIVILTLVVNSVCSCGQDGNGDRLRDPGQTEEDHDVERMISADPSILVFLVGHLYRSSSGSPSDRIPFKQLPLSHVSQL